MIRSKPWRASALVVGLVALALAWACAESFFKKKGEELGADKSAPATASATFVGSPAYGADVQEHHGSEGVEIKNFGDAPLQFGVLATGNAQVGDVAISFTSPETKDIVAKLDEIIRAIDPATKGIINIDSKGLPSISGSMRVSKPELDRLKTLYNQLAIQPTLNDGEKLRLWVARMILIANGVAKPDTLDESTERLNYEQLKKWHERLIDERVQNQHQFENLELVAQGFFHLADYQRRTQQWEAAVTNYERFIELTDSWKALGKVHLAICQNEWGDALQNEGKLDEANKHQGIAIALAFSVPFTNQDAKLEDKDGDGQPDGWFLKTKVPAPRFAMELEDDQSVLRLFGEHSSFAFWRLLKPTSVENCYLEWQWKARIVPSGGRALRPDERGQSSKAPAPMQVLVAFLRAPDPVVLHYTWNRDIPSGAQWVEEESVATKDIPEDALAQFPVLRLLPKVTLQYAHLVVQSGPPTDDWIQVRRNLAKDYRSFFPDEKNLPQMVLLGVQSTTWEATGPQTSDASIKQIRLKFPNDQDATSLSQ